MLPQSLCENGLLSAVNGIDLSSLILLSTVKDWDPVLQKQGAQMFARYNSSKQANIAK